MAVYSERLGSLSGEQLQAALRRFGLGDLIAAEPVSAGLFGQNVFLSAASGEWVFRGAPHWPWQFAKERFFAERLNAHSTTPVPWPYFVERDEKLFGWGYALMPRLGGEEPGDLAERDPEDRREIAAAMGDALAGLHEVGSEEVGEYDPRLGHVRAEASFSDWYRETLRRRIAETRKTVDAWDEEDDAFIEELLRENGPALEVPFRPGFVHYDYKPGNVVVERQVGTWAVTGVFDLMTCAFGDAEEDLSRTTAEFASLDGEAARRFVAAYCDRRPLRPGARERFRLYMVADRLVLWEYGRRETQWFPPELRFRDFARGFIGLDSLVEDPSG